MVTDAQVRLMRQKRMKGKTQEAAAAASGMSVRAARKWQSGPLPSSTKRRRSWRTRTDPFAEIWASEIAPLLSEDERGKLQAKTIFEVLVDKYPGDFEPGQLRTLQSRVHDWRAVRSITFKSFGEMVLAIGVVAIVRSFGSLSARPSFARSGPSCRKFPDVNAHIKPSDSSCSSVIAPLPLADDLPRCCHFLFADERV